MFELHSPCVRLLSIVACAVVLNGCATEPERPATPAAPERAPEVSMQIEYLEIVTPDVASVCATYERVHGVEFGEPVAELGGARTAELAGGGRVGVRPPLRETEDPVVRPYVLVEDIEAAVAAAEAAGATIAHPPMELPGQGTFAIYIQDGVEFGLWQR